MINNFKYSKKALKAKYKYLGFVFLKYEAKRNHNFYYLYNNYSNFIFFYRKIW